MTRQQATIKVSLALLALLLAAPATSHAAPLLSGYGGPGSGSQAILGSTLIGGSGGGGGSGGATTQGAGSAGVSSPGALAGSSAGSSSGSRPLRTHAARHATKKPGAPHAGAPAPSEAATGPLQRASDSATGGWRLAGLSSLDLLYAVIIIGFLAFAGILTGKLARRPE
jgi:hypothetical protein